MKKLILGYKLSSVVLITSFIFSPLTVLAQGSSSQDVPIESSAPSETPQDNPTGTPSETIAPDPSFDPFSLDEPENQSEDSPQILLDGELDSEDIPKEDSGDPPPSPLGGEEDPSLPGGLNGQFSPEFKKPETDLSTGALTYQFPIQVPPGRNGVQPDISLVYNNQDANNIGNILGYGWSVSIPHIERVNLRGIEDLYPAGYATASFRSSLSGELVRISSGSYGPKTDSTDFIRYTLASGSWSLTDKSGTVYRFGQTASSQQDSTDHSKKYKWLLNNVTDTNGNYITYEYVKNAGQIYPATISWTGFGADPGIFTLHFQRQTRTDSDIYYTPGFGVRNSYRISRIEARVNGSWVHRYDLSYGTGDNGRRSLLASIVESGIAEDSTVTTLPAVQFSYSNTDQSWQSTSDGMLYESPLGQQIADVNNDGLPDVVKGTDSEKSTRLYLLNGSEAFGLASPQFVPPINLYQTATPRDRGVRLDDLNGDFKADMHYYILGEYGARQSYINDGTGWTSSTSWYPEVPIIDPYSTTLTHIFDVNGDSLTDVFRSGYAVQDHRLNSGSGWGATSLTTPVYLSDKVYVLDANGDGFNDLVYSTGTVGRVYLFTGSGWEVDTTFATASINFSDYTADTGARVADMNGDGLPDLIKNNCDSTPYVYLNTGTGWDSASWEIPYDFVTCAGVDGLVRILDFTGDGMPDISAYNASSYKNTGKKADQLTLITFPQGGTASISYKGSAQYRSSANTLLNPKLPVILQTVKEIVLNPKDGSTTASTSYVYENGDYYYGGPFDRRISGFGKVTKTDSKSKTITYFHQGNTSSSAWSEPTDHKSKIGKPFRIDAQDRNGNLYKRTWNNWMSVDLGQDRWFSVLASTQEQIYDGNSTHKDTLASYSYETNFGNLTKQIELGQVNGSSTDGSFTDTGTDKFTTLYSYASNSGDNIFLPSQITKNDQSSNKVNEVKNYYDSQSLGILTNGNLTKQEQWASASTYIDIEKTYNSYGLVIQDKDPRDKASSFSYDTYSIYPVRSDDALGHESSRSFDYSSGKVKKFLDPNGLTFENVYDGLDRLIEEKQPDISEGESLMAGGGEEEMMSLFSSGEKIASGSKTPISDLLKDKTPAERANIKGQAIAGLDLVGTFETKEYTLEIVSINAIKGGVQVFAKVWKSGKQLGFGVDGSVDIERFKIYNPPIFVPDVGGDIVRNWTDVDGVVHENKFREDSKEALLESLTHTISVKKQKFGNDNIILNKVGNTTSTFYGHTGDAMLEYRLAGAYSTAHDASAATHKNYDGSVGGRINNLQAGGNWYIARYLVTFDTSALNDSDTIDSSTLSIYAGGTSIAGADSISLVGSTPADNTSIEVADWDQVGTTKFSTDINLTNWDSNVYEDFNLNSNGIASISLTGYSRFALRSLEDLNNSADADNDYGYYTMADETGTTKDPKLVVEHSGSTAGTRNRYEYLDDTGSTRIVKSQYLDGTTVAETYTYFDGLNRKLQERKEAEGGNFAVRDFLYNNRGLLAKESVPYYSPASFKTSATTTTNLYASYSYDSLSRPNLISNAIGSTSYTYDDWKTIVRDPRGKNKYLFNDAYNNLTRVDEINNGASYSTNYTYDGNNNLTKITDALGNVRNFTHNGLGRRLTAQDLHDPSDATFGTWTYAYDSSGNLASSSDPKSQRIDYTYDDLNRVLTENYTGQSGTEVTYTYDNCTNGVGRLCLVISSGASTSYKYSKIGPKIQERTKLGSTTYQTDYTHDRQGNLLTIANPDSSEVQYGYNSAGQLETIQRKESTDGSFKDVITNFNYSPHGKISSQSFANCVETENYYDSAKMYRLVNIFTQLETCSEEMMMFGGGGESLMALSNSKSTTPVSDLLKDKTPAERANIKGQAIATSNLIGTFETVEYTIEIVSVDAIEGGVQVLAKAWKDGQQLGFGEDGSVDIERFKILNPPILVPDPNGDIVRDWTDVDGKVHENRFREDLQEALLESLVHTISVKKDKFDDKNIIPGKIGHTTYTFYADAGDAMLEYRGGTSYSTPHNAATATNKNYDGTVSGRINNLQAGANWYIARYLFTFDTSALNDSNQIDASTLSIYAGGTSIAGADSISLVGSTPADNTSIEVADWDQTGTTKFSTDINLTNWDSNVYEDFTLNSSGIDNISSTGYSRFAIKSLEDLDNSADTDNDYGYYTMADETGTTKDPKLVVEDSVPNTSLQNIAYLYDANNNITRITDDSATNAAKLATFSYDDLNRLTRAQIGSASYGSNYTHTYGYDALGNITSKSDEGIYTYATQSFGGSYANPHAVYNISGIASFSYDSNGNLTNVASNSSNIATMSWDYRNRMSKYKSATASVSYSYDQGGQRTIVNNDTTNTHYPTKFYNYDGTNRIKHIFTPDGLLVAMVKGTGASISLHYIHNDHLGGTNVSTNASGSMESLNDYYAYGETRIEQGSPVEQRGFTSYEKDRDIGLNYASSRYQSGKWGRFTSQDEVFLMLGSPEAERLAHRRLSGILSDPQVLNSYSYARNNPIILKDDSGKFVQIIPGLVIGAAIGVGMQGFQDYISGRSSDWETYAGAAAGGAVSGATAAATGGMSLLYGGLAGATQSTVEQTLRYAFDNGPAVNGTQIAKQAVTGAIFSGIGNVFTPNISGLNVGTNSITAQATSIGTKLTNGAMSLSSNVQVSTVGKLAGAVLTQTGVSSFGQSAFQGYNSRLTGSTTSNISTSGSSAGFTGTVSRAISTTVSTVTSFVSSVFSFFR